METAASAGQLEPARLGRPSPAPAPTRLPNGLQTHPGVHHTKALLLEFGTGLRLVVHSGPIGACLQAPASACRARIGIHAAPETVCRLTRARCRPAALPQCPRSATAAWRWCAGRWALLLRGQPAGRAGRAHRSSLPPLAQRSQARPVIRASACLPVCTGLPPAAAGGARGAAHAAAGPLVPRRLLPVWPHAARLFGCESVSLLLLLACFTSVAACCLLLAASRCLLHAASLVGVLGRWDAAGPAFERSRPPLAMLH